MKLILLIFIALISGSFQSFANDIEETNKACPEGTYSSFGRLGKGCCTKDNLFIYGSNYQYVEVNLAGCGCPKGGEQTNNGKGCCSADGYAFNPYSMKYDKFSPYLCCPFGGERVSSGECCKNNYEYNEQTKKYDLINGHCGCPDGGTPKGDGCCKDGIYSGSCCYSTKTNASYLNPKVCGCPGNGIPVNRGDTMGSECCTPDRLYRWSYSTNSYSDWCPTCCGCPDGGVYKSRNVFIGTDDVCCKGNLALDRETKKYTRPSSTCKTGRVVK